MTGPDDWDWDSEIDDWIDYDYDNHEDDDDWDDYYDPWEDWDEQL
jgi:hypothetical protein